LTPPCFSPMPPTRHPAHASRSFHRSRSHASAHENAQADAAPPALIEHPLVPARRATLVERQAELDAILVELRQAGRFAYDSEFIGEQSYLPQLCLIQIAIPQRVALIDP